MNGRAWFRATCPVATYRDGAQAVAAATRACELTGWKEPGLLDTLAAAYAESGDFDSAVKWQAKAIELETDAKEKAEFGARLKLYKDKEALSRDEALIRPRCACPGARSLERGAARPIHRLTQSTRSLLASRLRRSDMHL